MITEPLNNFLHKNNISLKFANEYSVVFPLWNKIETSEILNENLNITMDLKNLIEYIYEECIAKDIQVEHLEDIAEMDSEEKERQLNIVKQGIKQAHINIEEVEEEIERCLDNKLDIALNLKDNPFFIYFTLQS